MLWQEYIIFWGVIENTALEIQLVDWLTTSLACNFKPKHCTWRKFYWSFLTTHLSKVRGARKEKKVRNKVVSFQPGIGRIKWNTTEKLDDGISIKAFVGADGVYKKTKRKTYHLIVL